MRGVVPDLAGLQARVIADICEDSDAERFIVAPTYYSYDSRLAREFGAEPQHYLRDLGRAVAPGIDFFWTGEQVISEGYPAEHLARVAADMGRRPFIRDNYIANDSRSRTDYLFLDPTSGSWELASELAAGLAINPMNQAHLSHISLAGYRHLLTGGERGPAAVREICRKLCGHDFAERLVADLDALQARGLGGLDAPTRRMLCERYESDTANPTRRRSLPGCAANTCLIRSA